MTASQPGSMSVLPDMKCYICHSPVESLFLSWLWQKFCKDPYPARWHCTNEKCNLYFHTGK